jgi:hypothetical protein
LLRLEFLEANHIGLGFDKPGNKVIQALVDVIDVERGDFQD